MSLARTFYVKCDLCGMERSPDQHEPRAARRLARQTGWTRRAGAEDKLLDVGPVCRAGEQRAAEERRAQGASR